MEYAHKEERRHEMGELGRATRNCREEKEDFQKERTVTKLDIYASRKHLS